jgi:hypothetical protein
MSKENDIEGAYAPPVNYNDKQIRYDINEKLYYVKFMNTNTIYYWNTVEDAKAGIDWYKTHGNLRASTKDMKAVKRIQV